jgi:hypothetical protein
MSKYQHLRELLREAYPLYNSKTRVDEVMERIEKIRDAEKKKQPI